MSLEICVGRAHAFVEKQGSRLDLLFLDTMLQEQLAAELLGSLEALQDARGAIAAMDGPGGEADLASTAKALGRLETLGLGDHPVPERACVFLCGLQGDDGGWALPGDADLSERIEWTGRIGGLLAGTPFARQSVLSAAEGFLATHWSVDRVKGPNYAPILAYSRLLTQVQSEIADEVLQWCGKELEYGYRSQLFTPLATARVFLRAGVRALPGANLEAHELVTALITAQQDDGSWHPDESFDPVEATTEAVEALLRLS
ncbi:MAG: hypothetical protein GY937_00605 [bacterium]|nr:hypothetical protein [bacterium]